MFISKTQLKTIEEDRAALSSMTGREWGFDGANGCYELPVVLSQGRENLMEQRRPGRASVVIYKVAEERGGHYSAALRVVSRVGQGDEVTIAVGQDIGEVACAAVRCLAGKSYDPGA